MIADQMFSLFTQLCSSVCYNWIPVEYIKLSDNSVIAFEKHRVGGI